MSHIKKNDFHVTVHLKWKLKLLKMFLFRLILSTKITRVNLVVGLKKNKGKRTPGIFFKLNKFSRSKHEHM